MSLSTSKIDLTKIAEFDDILNIETWMNDQCDESSCQSVAGLFLKISGVTDLLHINCTSVQTADSIADLIDGYCRLNSPNSVSVWTNNCFGKIFELIFQILMKLGLM